MLRLRRENEGIKDALSRALKELKAFQIKFPTAYSSIVQEAESLDEPLPLFSDAMLPLLRIYDNRIKELEDIAVQQVSNLEGMQTQVESLVRENQELRKTNLEQLQASSNGFNKQSLNSTNPLQNELLNELNERVDILMSENGLLVEQKSFMNKELDEYQDIVRMN